MHDRAAVDVDEKLVDENFVDEGPPQAAAEEAEPVVAIEPRRQPEATALDQNQLARLLGKSPRGGGHWR